MLIRLFLKDDALLHKLVVIFLANPWYDCIVFFKFRSNHLIWERAAYYSRNL